MDSLIVIICCIVLLLIRYACYIWEIKSQYEDFIRILKTNWLKAKQEKRFFKKRLIEKIEKEKDWN